MLVSNVSDICNGAGVLVNMISNRAIFAEIDFITGMIVEGFFLLELIQQVFEIESIKRIKRSKAKRDRKHTNDCRLIMMISNDYRPIIMM